MSNVDGSSDRDLPDAASPGRAHPEIEEQLAAYTAGALPPLERQRIMAHLEACPACRQALAEIWRVRRLLRALADPPVRAEATLSLADAVMARLTEAGEAGLDGDDAPTGTWAPLEDADVAITPDPSVGRPVLDEPGVLSPDFRPTPPLSYGRGRTRGWWRPSYGGSERESIPMDRHIPRGADDRPTVSASALSRRDSAPAYPRPTRWSGYSAVAATAAIILLSVLVLGVLGAHLRALGPGGAPAPATPTPAAPQSALVPHGAVSSISMVSPTEGWAVGPVAPDGSNVLLHYTGGRWVRASDVVPGVVLSRVSMDSAQDGWAAGLNVKAPKIQTGIFLHYSGGRWVVASDTFPGVELHSISMDSADDGWAVGVMSDQVTGIVLRFTGGHWIQVQTSISMFNGTKVQALAANDVWIAASLPKSQAGLLGSTLLHYYNGAWTVIGSPAGIDDISMLSDDEGWATSLYTGILHYQAGRWTVAAAATAGHLFALQMFSPNEGWAVGGTNDSPRRAFIMRYDGRMWREVPGPAASGKTELSSVAIVSSGEVWAGGDETPASGKPPVSTSTPASDKTPVATPTPAGIGGFSGDQTLASVGIPVATATPSSDSVVSDTTVAMLLHYSGGQWKQVPVPVR